MSKEGIDEEKTGRDDWNRGAFNGMWKQCSENFLEPIKVTLVRTPSNQECGG